MGMDGPVHRSAAAGTDTGLPLLYWRLLHGSPARIPSQQQRDIVVSIHHGSRAAWRWAPLQHLGEALRLPVCCDAGWPAQWSGHGVQLLLRVHQPALPNSRPHHCFQAGVTVLGYYFVRWRTLANAMASTGVSLGFTLWPLLSRYLLDEMGWRNTFLIFGGILLNCCVCGAIMRPVELAPGTPLQSPNPAEEPERRAEGAQLSNTASSPHPKIQKQTRRTACVHALQKYLAFDIFCQNKGYQIYTIGVTWMMMGFALPHVYLVPYAIHSGVEERRAALLISVIGLINIFIRPLTGLLSGHRIFTGRRIYLFSLAVLLCGLSNFICVISAEFSVLIVYCVILSIAMSGIGALTFQVLMDVVEMDRFSNALGLFTILESITILVGPPLTGLLVDVTNDFRYVFYNSSFFLISAALFMGLSFCTLEKKNKLKEGSKVPLDSPFKYQYNETPAEPQCESPSPPAVVYITSI
ncbi:monocarboxylate transporter 6 isoform X2 [Cuculus canorus]|uniref:monocarboxylate transporter 6 isoform X2 n=1 Tax=Cuculus canorus TaxID=55661 RepID=UPI0023AB053F|nr:monocarboxylate transporter 6 isoform X2 [Cuculus canorus]